LNTSSEDDLREPARDPRPPGPRDATTPGSAASPGVRPWHGLGAAALAFVLVAAVTSDLCASVSPLVGEPAVSFASTVVGGEGADEGDRIELEALRGRVVVLDFWASWCPPCRASVPALEAFSHAHPEVVVLGVNVESNRRASFVREAHRELGASYPTVHDTDGSLQTAYRITALPTLLVVDTTGEVRDAHVGAVDRAWLEEHAGSN
jgi:thiol-disulfide isomerase/thioredoxin